MSSIFPVYCVSCRPRVAAMVSGTAELKFSLKFMYPAMVGGCCSLWWLTQNPRGF